MQVSRALPMGQRAEFAPGGSLIRADDNGAKAQLR